MRFRTEAVRKYQIPRDNSHSPISIKFFHDTLEMYIRPKLYARHQTWQHQSVGVYVKLQSFHDVHQERPRVDGIQTDFHLCRHPAIQRQSLVQLRSEEHTSELQSRGHLVC